MFKQIHKVHKAGKCAAEAARCLLWSDRRIVSRIGHACMLLVHVCVFICVCVCVGFSKAVLVKLKDLEEPPSQNSLDASKRVWRGGGNWEKPLIDTELSWEICSNFVALTESHSRYKACLFWAARAASAATHTHTLLREKLFHDDVSLKNIHRLVMVCLMCLRIPETPWIFTSSCGFTVLSNASVPHNTISLSFEYLLLYYWKIFLKTCVASLFAENSSFGPTEMLLLCDTVSLLKAQKDKLLGSSWACTWIEGSGLCCLGAFHTFPLWKMATIGNYFVTDCI